MIKTLPSGLPWWFSGKESSYQYRRHRFDPWSHLPQSNLAHVPQLLSLCSGAWELQLLSLCTTAAEVCMPRTPAPQQEKPQQREALALQLERSLHDIKDQAQPYVDKIIKTQTHTQRNASESVPMRWMNLESIIPSEVSQKDKNRILMHICGV